MRLLLCSPGPAGRVWCKSSGQRKGSVHWKQVVKKKNGICPAMCLVLQVQFCILTLPMFSWKSVWAFEKWKLDPGLLALVPLFRNGSTTSSFWKSCLLWYHKRPLVSLTSVHLLVSNISLLPNVGVPFLASLSIDRKLQYFSREGSKGLNTIFSEQPQWFLVLWSWSHCASRSGSDSKRMNSTELHTFFSVCVKKMVVSPN